MIAEANRHALKEWAITIEFLKTGRQVFLLRKGGIHEQRKGFRVEHKEFFLFPTYLHQSLSALHPMTHSGFEQPEFKRTSENLIRFDTYAKVRESIEITDLRSLRGLDGMHTLNWSTVEQRFYYRNRPGLHLILLQAFSLPEPHWVENEPEYDGCVSWVELTREHSTKGAASVLPPAEFEAKADDVRKLVALKATS